MPLFKGKDDDNKDKKPADDGGAAFTGRESDKNFKPRTDIPSEVKSSDPPAGAKNLLAILQAQYDSAVQAVTAQAEDFEARKDRLLANFKSQLEEQTAKVQEAMGHLPIDLADVIDGGGAFNSTALPAGKQRTFSFTVQGQYEPGFQVRTGTPLQIPDGGPVVVLMFAIPVKR